MSALLLSPNATPPQQQGPGISRIQKPHEFVRQVAQLLKRQFRHAKATKLNLVANERDLEILAERFLDKREEFRSQRKPILVEIAFHYTKAESVESIQAQGLLRSPEKQHHGRYYGAGVYVANNPHAFMNYGDVGLVCLIIKGGLKQMYSSKDAVDASADCLQGNKLARAILNQKIVVNGTIPTSPYFDEIVLRRSAQVLPLLRYQRDLVNNAELLWDLQRSLQRLVDHFFEQGHPTVTKRILPDYRDLQNEHTLKNVRFASFPSQPQRPFLNQSKTPSHVSAPIVAPPLGVSYCLPSPQIYGFCTPLLFDSAKKNNCPICFVSLKQNKAVILDKCKHSFHEKCLEKAAAVSNKCPICRVAFGASRGCCPYGTLTIHRQTTKHCGSFERFATLCLEYSIPSGIQTALHSNPGSNFAGTKRLAYLPDTKEGRDLLKRLRYAFSHGLTFTVGTSLTSGKSNVVCWTSIPHKTVLCGGTYGFPDPGYFPECNAALDAFCVPKACDL